MSLFLISTILLNGSSPAPVDSRRLALELSSADWFKWVTWYGYAVAVGCAMEVWEVSITIKEWCLLKFCKKEVEQDEKSWAIPFAAVGLILIVVGIVLETYCEGKAADAETELRNHFSEKLSTAESNLGIAQKATAQLTKDSTQLQKDTEGEKLARVVAQTRLEQEQQRTVRAQEDLAKAQLALKTKFDYTSKLEGARDIDRTRFLAALRGNPQANVVIWYASNDQESFLFAQQIWVYLAGQAPLGAGWVTTSPLGIPKGFSVQQPEHFAVSIHFTGLTGSMPTTSIIRTPPPYNPGDPVETQYRGSYTGGITLLAKSVLDASAAPSRPPTALMALADALSDSTGLSVVSQQEDAVPDGSIILVVTQKLAVVPRDKK